jgi:hypothetical protein
MNGDRKKHTIKSLTRTRPSFQFVANIVNHKIEVYGSATERTWSSRCWILQLSIAMVWQNLMGIGCGVTDCLEWCDVGFAQKDGNLWDKLVHWHSTRRIILGEKWLKLALALWMCMRKVNLSHVLLRSSFDEIPRLHKPCYFKLHIEDPHWNLRPYQSHSNLTLHAYL